MKPSKNRPGRRRSQNAPAKAAESKSKVAAHLTPPPGTVMAPYPARNDRIYRGALWAMAGVFLVVAVAIVWHSEWLAEIGAAVGVLANLAAAWTFLVWLPQWRWAVRILAFMALFGWALSLPLLLWGGLLAATAIMAAKEYHCFKFWTGRYLPWVSLAAGVAWLIGSGIPLVVLFWALSGGWMALLWERSRLPLFEVTAEQLHVS